MKPPSEASVDNTARGSIPCGSNSAPPSRPSSTSITLTRPGSPAGGTASMTINDSHPSRQVVRKMGSPDPVVDELELPRRGPG